jgi:hypothetical protein
VVVVVPLQTVVLEPLGAVVFVHCAVVVVVVVVVPVVVPDEDLLLLIQAAPTTAAAPITATAMPAPTPNETLFAEAESTPHGSV